MFTGLVEACGRVERIEQESAGVRLVIDVAGTPLAQTGPHDGREIGASIAINGCCLTVVAADGPLLEFQAGSETLSKTNLGRLRAGDPVNLERSLPVGARLGGHFVQGHVDGVGTVRSIRSEPAADGQEWVFMAFTVPDALAGLMVPKGSVAVDGISLTLVDVGTDSFSVALIPHTLEVTTLGRRPVGDAVNIETDILGKYVQKLLESGGRRAES
jgi:riboflavin synthase